MMKRHFKYNGIQLNFKNSDQLIFIYKKNKNFKQIELLDAVNEFFAQLFGSCESSFTTTVGGFTDIIAKTNNKEILISWSNCYIY